MIRSILAKVLFVSSIILFLVFTNLLFARYSRQNLSFASVPTMLTKNSARLPVGLSIPSLEKSLNVIPSVIRDGQWQTTDKGVSYLSTSTTPGEVGNAIFYGHNYPHLLGDLKNVQAGAKILITERDGKEIIYTVTQIRTVKPSDTSILAQSTDRRLTLYTCSGLLDSERLVITAQTGV